MKDRHGHHGGAPINWPNVFDFGANLPNESVIPIRTGRPARPEKYGSGK